MTQLQQPGQNEVVQFVCFETPLPGIAFTLIWKPFAGSYITQGLRQIVLSEREDAAQGDLSFKFVSRNVWPASAFAHVLDKGKIGEGGVGPIHALQGGTFHVSGNALDGARIERDKIMGLFRLRNAADLTELVRTVTEGLSADQGVVALSVYHQAVITSQQRFDLIVEVYSQRGQGKETAVRLETLVSGAIEKKESAFGSYRETLVLPVPATQQKK